MIMGFPSESDRKAPGGGAPRLCPRCGRVITNLIFGGYEYWQHYSPLHAASEVVSRAVAAAELWLSAPVAESPAVCLEACSTATIVRVGDGASAF